MIEKSKWILCPICNSKTRAKIYSDTVLINFPLYCPKCKQDINVNIRMYTWGCGHNLRPNWLGGSPCILTKKN